MFTQKCNLALQLDDAAPTGAAAATDNLLCN